MLTAKDAKDAKVLEDLASEILNAAFHVHTTLGAGLLESVYEKCLACELVERGFQVEIQKGIPIIYRHLQLDAGFRADLLVNGRLLVELKAVESLQSVHTAQVLTYLKLMKLPLALLINFNVPHLKQGVKRIVLTNQNSPHSPRP